MLLLAFLLLNIIYNAGFFTFSILLRVSEQHYLIGYNKAWFSFKVRGVTISIGTYIPLPGVSPIFIIKDGEKQPMKYPWEFIETSIIKRTIVTFSGALTLLLTGLLLYIGVTYFQPDQIITKEEVNRLGIYPSPLAEKSGLQRGDKILALNGDDYREYRELINPEVISKAGTHYTVERDGKKFQVEVKASLDELRSEPFLLLLAPFTIERIEQGSPADQAGMLPNDKVLRANGKPVIKYLDVNKIVADTKEETVTLDIERIIGDKADTISIVVKPGSNRKLGYGLIENIKYTPYHYSLGEAIHLGITSAFQSVQVQWRTFYHLTFGTTKAVGGPIGVARAHGSRLFTTALATGALFFAFWNILPLPRAAFWELIPLAYEGITRKRYPHATFAKTTRATIFFGIALFAVWIVVVIVSDLLKIFDGL